MSKDLQLIALYSEVISVVCLISNVSGALLGI